MKKINAVDDTANTNDTGIRSENENNAGNMKTSIAPSPAPADMPSSPGSARLFLNAA